MIKTIKELLIEWWAESTTTKMPIPTIYTYIVDVDGGQIHIESMSRSRNSSTLTARSLLITSSARSLKATSRNSLSSSRLTYRVQLKPLHSHLKSFQMTKYA